MQQITTASGATVFVKWFVPGQDWQARLTADTGREALLWSQGWLDQLPAGVGHPILAAEEFGEGMGDDLARSHAEPTPWQAFDAATNAGLPRRSGSHV
jgi:hypothetical protein